jgi:hypothetical protein
MEFAATTDIRDMMDIVGEVSSNELQKHSCKINYPLFGAFFSIYLFIYPHGVTVTVLYLQSVCEKWFFYL